MKQRLEKRTWVGEPGGIFFFEFLSKSLNFVNTFSLTSVESQKQNKRHNEMILIWEGEGSLTSSSQPPPDSRHRWSRTAKARRCLLYRSGVSGLENRRKERFYSFSFIDENRWRTEEKNVQQKEKRFLVLGFGLFY